MKGVICNHVHPRKLPNGGKVVIWVNYAQFGVQLGSFELRREGNEREKLFEIEGGVLSLAEIL